ncbi:glutamyl-tRNA(Gln) amidotransferase subunit A-like [Ylistrum balloti]|uniref:glutamyl-tRNA(Gln) amidotransferase subunit A-like n=1 Tax=Ylistrum balloti TaxID=509963 RepID=UPI002905CC3B|nr:glutamyl-tRNA(Gln) amidotransferase subunit A-like [Ylistrum balloti]
MKDDYWNTILTSSRITSESLSGLHGDSTGYFNVIKKINKDLNAFVFYNENIQTRKVDAVHGDATHAASSTHSIPCAIKSNIAMKGMPLHCASNLLKDFTSPVHASAIAQLLDAGFSIVGLTNMDEFGMGSSTTHSIFGRTANPWDIGRSPGGSSGGSAAAVAAGMVPFALGSDTGGSVRQPAMFCGVWGLKPSYGAVSRYGLVAYSSSLDVIGIIAEQPSWLRKIFSIIKVKGRDPKDTSSFYPQKTPSEQVKKVAVYIPRRNIAEEIRNGMLLAVQQYRNIGYEVTEIDLPIFDYAAAVYLNISTAEASSNLARFDGIRYGTRDATAQSSADLVRRSRNAGFGSEVKLRVLTGAYILQSGFQDQYYTKARALQKHIQKTLLSLFKHYDLLILPVFPTQSFRFDDTQLSDFAQKLGDTFSVVANLAGLPAASFPVAWYNGLPMGAQVVGPLYTEDRICLFLENTAHLFEHRYSPYAKKFFEHSSRDLQDREAMMKDL